ncbi:hypothetical protein [Chryseobacterium jejuense]|uniref:hypothetical protein n=1 Tax=Chryseobacterium jejuense TaxID=445960 RepID=UPI001AEB5893|nr:hypothetical protein [Chryseobacterium jejuense]MBP2617420.1 hypothetical protein [Chryseobacterium jejuense]
MKLNKILFSLMLICAMLVHAQKNVENIDGVYKGKGAVFIINKNKTFLIMAYATLIKGTWNIEKDLIYLKPKNPEDKFFVYARKNPDIKIGMRINFSGDGIGNSNIVVGEFPNKMQALFNDDANCLDYPNVHVFKEKWSSVTLLEDQNEENWKVSDIPRVMYSFPTGDYNDFIVQHMQDSLYHNDFVFKITKKGLSDVNSGSGDVLKKSTIKDEFSNEKELEFINQSFDMAFAADYKLVNNAYNTNDDMNGKIDLNYYKYDKLKNVYVNPAVSAKELNYKSKDYHYNDVLMKFDRITGTSKPWIAVKKLPKPLFIANCNN